MSGRWGLPSFGLSTSVAKETDVSEKTSPPVTSERSSPLDSQARVAALFSAVEQKREVPSTLFSSSGQNSGARERSNSPSKGRPPPIITKPQDASPLSTTDSLSNKVTGSEPYSKPLVPPLEMPRLPATEPFSKLDASHSTTPMSALGLSESKLLDTSPIAASLASARSNTGGSESKTLEVVSQTHAAQHFSLTPRAMLTPRTLAGLPESNPLDVSKLSMKTSFSTGSLRSAPHPAVEPVVAETPKTIEDTQRLMRWDAEAQQVDKEQSEIMHQQHRLFREQVATLSGESLQTRNEIKELFRVIQTERAERVGACDTLRKDLEAERVARTGACHELERELAELRNSLDTGLQKSSAFMDEQSTIMDTRVREAESAFQQCIRNVESQLAEEKNARVTGDDKQERALEEHMLQLRIALSDFSSKNDVVKKELERESAERVRFDKELEEHMSQLRSILAEAATKADLKRGFDQEAAERAKVAEHSQDSLGQALEREGREREDLRRAMEGLAKSLSHEFTTTVEARMAGAEGLIQQVSRELQSHYDMEAKDRSAADHELRTTFADAVNSLKKNIEQEMIERAKGDENVNTERVKSVKDLEEQISKLSSILSEAATKADVSAHKSGLEKAFEDVRSILSGAATKVELQGLKNLLDNEHMERAKNDKTLEEHFLQLRPLVAAAGSKDDLLTLKNRLEKEITDRIKGNETLVVNIESRLSPLFSEGATKADIENANAERMKHCKALEEQLLKFAPMVVEAATTADLHAVKNFFDSENAARVKEEEQLAREVENMAQQIKRQLEQETQARTDTDRALEERFGQLGSVLAEAAARNDLLTLKSEFDRDVAGREARFKADLSSLKTDLEREVAARAEGDRDMVKQQTVETALKELSHAVQAQMEQEMKSRTMGDDQVLQFIKDALEKAELDNIEIKSRIHSGSEEWKLQAAETHESVRDLEDKFMQLRPLFADFASKGDITHVRGELEEKFAQLRPILADTASKVDISTIRVELERIPTLRAEFDDKLLQLRPILAEAATKNDFSLLRGDLEREVKERMLGEEGLAKTLRQENSQEETARSARHNELRSVLEALTSTMNDELRLMREGFGGLEKRLSANSIEHIDMRMSEVLTQLEKEVRQRSLFEDEVSSKMLEMAAIVERNRTDHERIKQDLQTEDSMLKNLLKEVEDTTAQHLKEIFIRLDAEIAARNKDHEIAISEFANRHNELATRSGELEQQIVERITRIVESVDVEKQERRIQFEKLQAALQNIPIDFLSQQMKDLWSSVETEAAQRKAGDEALHIALNNGLDTINRKQVEQDEEWQRGVASNKRVIEEECALHREEIMRIQSVLTTKLEEERSNRLRSMTETTTVMEHSKDHFNEEMLALRRSSESSLSELDHNLHTQKLAHAAQLKQIQEKLDVHSQDHARAFAELIERIDSEAKERVLRYEDVAHRSERRMQELEQQVQKSIENSSKEQADKQGALDSKLTFELKRIMEEQDVRLNEMREKLIAMSKSMNIKDRIF